MVLLVQVALGGTLIALVATDNVPFVADDDNGSAAAAVPRPAVDRFDSAAALASVRRQVALGPRPAGLARIARAGQAHPLEAAARPLSGASRAGCAT